MPVFRDGELIAFVQNSAHWSDAGGPVPGSFHAEAASTYGEALYITPIHLVREGELDEEVMRFILRNVRVPDTTQGDVFAQIASCRTGEARLQSLIDKYGLALIKSEMNELIHYSEALLREEFRKLPDGTYSFEDAIDFDPIGDRETPVRIKVSITIDGDRALYDLSGSDPAGAGGDQRHALHGAVGARRRDQGDLPARPRERGNLQRHRHDQPRRARHERAVPAADQRRLRDLLRGHLPVHLRLLPAGGAGALDGLLREHDEHGRGRLRRPRGLRPRLRDVPLERGRLRRAAGQEGQPHGHQPVRVGHAQRARRGAGAGVSGADPLLRVHHRLRRRRPPSRRHGRRARLRAHARRCDALGARQPRRHPGVGLGGRPGGPRQRPDLRRGRPATSSRWA